MRTRARRGWVSCADVGGIMWQQTEAAAREHSDSQSTDWSAGWNDWKTHYWSEETWMWSRPTGPTRRKISITGLRLLLVAAWDTRWRSWLGFSYLTHPPRKSSSISWASVWVHTQQDLLGSTCNKITDTNLGVSAVRIMYGPVSFRSSQTTPYRYAIHFE